MEWTSKQYKEDLKKLFFESRTDADMNELRIDLMETYLMHLLDVTPNPTSN